MKEIFVDLHAHTKPISRCCRAFAEEVITTAKEYGYDGLALANHYVSDYFTDDTYDEFIERYIAEWNYCDKLANDKGLILFRAIEVTADYLSGLHLLIYGADEKFIRENKRLNELSLEELYSTCKKNDCLLIQAHPFRNGAPIQDLNYLDGLELNSHPVHPNPHEKQISDTAIENKVILTGGTDYHADCKRVKGGMFLPSTVKTDKDLVEYLKTTKEYKISFYDAFKDETFIKTYKI